VLEDAVVDFVFVAMIDVVEQVKVLLFISNVGKLKCFFLIFFLFSLKYPTRFCCLHSDTKDNETSKKKFVDEERTTKIREK
jgi:hypothetical protein